MAQSTRRRGTTTPPATTGPINAVAAIQTLLKNIIASIKPSGLTSVFQAPRSQANNAGYLMDNAEVYRGLRDFAAMLRERGDTADAAYYELSGYYDRAWTFFNGNTPGWETGKLDPYPWAVLGLAAAKRGQTALANAQLASIDKTFSVNRALVTINELGFYQRTRSLLTGRNDI